ncbi:MAG: DUF302 domain-containing protein [Pseudomonadota bacterium]
MARVAVTALVLSTAPVAASATDLTPRAGWAVHPTPLSHADLVDATRGAIRKAGLGIVTQAGPTKAAAARGIEIPGNVVIGAYNNDFAVRVLALSTAAMIEAPIRFYVTENEDGTATLSYKRPSTVFAPYMDEAGPELAAIAAELDTLFASVATAVSE